MHLGSLASTQEVELLSAAPQATLISTPPGWDATDVVHCRVNPSIKFTNTHLSPWVERGTVRVKCLAQEHNTMPLGGA